MKINFIKNIFYDVLSVIRNRGFLNFIKILFSSFTDKFDQRTGVETAGRVLPEDISQNRDLVTHYAGTREKPLKELLKKMNVPGDYHFIDLGCGKGRVLIIALEYGLKKVTGVEISSSLLEQARWNLSRFTQSKEVEVSFALGDFTEIELPRGEIYYMYDPCKGEMLMNIFRKIHESTSHKAGEAMIIYHNNLIPNLDEFSNVLPGWDFRSEEISGNQFFIIERKIISR